MPARLEASEVEQDTYNAFISTTKMLKRAALAVFSAQGLSESQFQALDLLVDNGPMLMRKMSDAMLVTPANITGIVDRLEEKKLVNRTASTGDRRATIIEITPEGRTLHDRVGKKKAELVRKTLSAFTKEEQKAMYNLLDKFQREMSRSIGKD